ncbi:bacillithiol biosynthesis cysteine-adding enzyme BshC [Bacillus sp. VT 712]|uniref:bacillithiol biosynthesis cysteine-adding enzyme BshC n=1 Tax=Bacillaceae TaxID=186817 RepID=UPI000473AA8C|nr:MULTISPECIES: bacillithiol biosynthesis cysteine-adding enzyme BshC [Bacillaceae]KZB92519.1 bacillithiol biosynthesis cysteine-adding enzyme BshC [Bacillus sp. VT 712]
MEITDVSLSATNKLTEEYIQGSNQAMSYFHYNIHKSDVYKERLHDLKSYTHPREELVEYLTGFNKKLNASNKTLENIEQLRDQDSVVVVGGQQAGLLTGPLYTIHKVISIILLAKQEEEALGVPVLPVFWIAGEDHDFAEINHVYVEEKGQMLKKTFKQSLKTKDMVSNVNINQEACSEWIDSLFQLFGETEHTKEVLSFLKCSLQQSQTFTDFFAYLTTKLFTEYGLILMDAASEELRKIESSFFIQLIEQNEALSQSVMAQQKKLSDDYKKVIDVGSETAHLFYSHEGNRILLERDEAQNFKGKQDEVSFSKENLIQIAKQSPHLLSNNVVTRPLMQEYLLPTLAFVAGPGEVAYWAELQQAFNIFNFTMPPVVPRLSYTLVERNIAKYLEELNINSEKAVVQGVATEREAWLRAEVRNPYEGYFNEAKEKIEEIHKTLRENVQKEDKTFEEVLLKNRAILQKQMETVQKIVESKQLIKHDVTHTKYNKIECALRPNGAPQERIWNVAYYLNKYGMQFVSQLLNEEVEFNHHLKVCYL